MNCPKCGHWNQASFPRCIKCGEELAVKQSRAPVGVKPAVWQGELKTDGQKKYIHVDDDGNIEQVADSREVLASHMADLKKRKVRGESRQRQLRTEGAKRGYAPSNMSITRHTARTTFFTFEEDDLATVHKVDASPYDRDMPVFDSLEDSGVLDIRYSNTGNVYYPRPQDVDYKKITVRRIGLRRFWHALLVIVIVAVLAFGGYTAYNVIQTRKSAVKEQNRPIVTATMLDDMAAHTIMIPGQDGQQIYIRELRLSYEVSGGYATIEIPDHTWYDDTDDFLPPTMTVTINPFLKTATGQQKPLDPVAYDIDIPLSRIELLAPDVTRLEVATAMYTIKFRVQENSTVFVNDENLTDMVNLDGGDVTYNATVQPIGDNTFTITVKSQYCRENTISMVLYRAPQEIPLDLASDTHSTSSSTKMQITVTTLPGASIHVLTPYTDLDITDIDTTGTFSFYAVFNHIGYNDVTITADYPNKKQTVITHIVYHVPPPDEYTKVAWGIVENYADLLANNAMRTEQTKKYVCIGTIEYVVSEKPQMVVMNAGTKDEPCRVLLENNTKTTWIVGNEYRIYADAYGMYDDMPRLQARYTYPVK